MRLPKRSGHIEEQISDAMARGDFDNLKGKGRPLNLQGDLSDPKFAGQKLRHNAGFGAPWQDVAQEIDGLERKAQAIANRLQIVRATLRARNLDASQIEAELSPLRGEIEATLRTANSLILKFNLIIPPQLPHLHRARLKVEAYLENDPT